MSVQEDMSKIHVSHCKYAIGNMHMCNWAALNLVSWECFSSGVHISIKWKLHSKSLIKCVKTTTTPAEQRPLAANKPAEVCHWRMTWCRSIEIILFNYLHWKKSFQKYVLHCTPCCLHILFVSCSIIWKASMFSM